MKQQLLTAQLLFTALKEDVELESPIEMFLDSKEVAPGVDLIWELKNECRVWVSLLSVGVRLDDILGMPDHGALDMICSKRSVRALF